MYKRYFSNIWINELIHFFRIEICLFITGISLTGYLLFNEIALKIAYVALSTFFISSAAYSYNLITDKKEDILNHKKINLFVMNNKGIYLVCLFTLLGLFFSYFVSPLSFKITVFLAITGIFYSFFRVKEIFPFKNIYTGFILTIVFFIGSSASNILSYSMFLHYLALSIVIFVVSLISDLRDYYGDKISGIRTVPVVLGYDFSKSIVAFLLVAFVVLVTLENLVGLVPLIPFSVIALIYVYINNPKKSHKILLFSFVCLPFIVTVML